LYDRHWLVTAVGDDMTYRSAGFAEVFDLHIIMSVFQQACLRLRKISFPA
jgi:hypothetical protein